MACRVVDGNNRAGSAKAIRSKKTSRLHGAISANAPERLLYPDYTRQLAALRLTPPGLLAASILVVTAALPVGGSGFYPHRSRWTDAGFLVSDRTAPRFQEV